MLVRKGRNHNHINGDDDINQLLWYPEDISRVVLMVKVPFFLNCLNQFGLIFSWPGSSR
jgi:hypothetical protein